MSYTTARRWRHNYVEYRILDPDSTPLAPYLIQEYKEDSCKWESRLMFDDYGAWEPRGNVGRFATIKGTRYFIWSTGEKTEFGHMNSNDFTPADEMIVVFETWLEKLEENT